jgi:UDP-glucose 4-epimerase
VRLSAGFGPWERMNEVRDTPSPQAQILAAMQGGERGRSAAAGR